MHAGADGFEIRRLTPEDWEVFRNVRLAALRDAPDALGATFAQEKEKTAEQWRGFLAQRVRYIAVTERDAVGTISVGPGPYSGTAAIAAVWVDPRFRGRGIGDALVDTALAWAKRESLGQVLLWVNEGSSEAERLYARNGFSRTGDTMPVAPDDSRLSFEMSRNA